MRMSVIVTISAALLAAACIRMPDDAASVAPLLQAAEEGDDKTVQILLEQHAEVDVLDACRWTPLMKAALNGHRATVERLLAFDAAVDAADKGGYTALMLAASNNHAGIVELLLQHGADVNHVEDTNGWTALIWAAKQGHVETVDVLIDCGADVTLRDHSGRDARQWAEQAGHATLFARWADSEARSLPAD